MKELTFEEAADFAMGEFFTNTGNYSDLVHIVECSQGFDDIGLEPIFEYSEESPQDLLERVNSLARSTQEMSKSQPLSQDELIDFVAKQISLWVKEEMEAKRDEENNSDPVSFEDRACEHIDGFIAELQDKAHKVRDAA